MTCKTLKIKDTSNKVLEKLHLKESSEFNVGAPPKREVTTVRRTNISHNTTTEGTILASLEKKSQSSEGIQDLLSVFSRAVELDHAQHHDAAFSLYMEGLNKVVPLLKTIEDESTKVAVRGQVVKYMTRTEELKVLLAEKKKTGTAQSLPEVPILIHKEPFRNLLSQISLLYLLHLLHLLLLRLYLHFLQFLRTIPVNSHLK